MKSCVTCAYYERSSTNDGYFYVSCKKTTERQGSPFYKVDNYQNAMNRCDEWVKRGVKA
jgi:hypothetical protein